MTAATEIRAYTPGGAPRPTAISQSTAVEQSRAIAEVQAAVVVAQSCPRDMAEAEREMEYVCGRLDMAEQAFYQVTNRGTGPSVHLARELARIWGNIDYGVKELHRDDEKGISEVLAFAWDVQKNSRSSRTFINPHQRMRQGSRVELTDLQDIYLSNQNIGARAVRETIFTILPRWFVEKAQNVCHNTLKHGEGKPLQDRIASLVAAFGELGVSEAQLEARVGRKRGTWTPEDLAQLTVAGTSIKRGEAQRDDLFPPIEAETTTESEIAPAEPEKKPTRARKSKADKEREQLEAEVVAAAQAADKAEGITHGEPAPADPGGVDGEATANAAEAAEANADTPPPAPAQEPEPAAPVEPERPRSKFRDPIEKRLFALIGEIKPPLEREDRIAVYRAILERPDVNSTNDLSDPEVGKICDQLFKWSQFGGTVLDDRVRDIVNAATIAAENAKEGQS
jgi:hypothetical protein